MPQVEQHISDEFWDEFQDMDTDEKRRCLHHMDRAELLEMRDRLQRKKASIQVQLDRAKSKAQNNGDYADPEWFSGAKHAKKMTGLNIQKVQDLLSEMNAEPEVSEGVLGILTPRQRESIQDMAFGQALAEVVREEFGEDLAQTLLGKARSRVNEAM